ncbi:putative metal-dependent enzyme (double-stranded beta helix superfamily) [Pseudomonas fluvialis]|uniref:Putative metal-dependent enzyme (Double-stranded beta helix superfamily) n=1 Tax=Pseudomonas fluvialis TaxID=1793966 RepID=A0A7X0EVR2_9PSED|nr:hypothetical protein [Pseudomonas fluvialis]MBB6342846.1 putative metal-dependent enzyme (double-stranded beta helix superfamily) [Pseudomonas fluvialis]
MNSLNRFVERVQSIWGPLSSEVVAGCKQQLDELMATPAAEPWLSELHQSAPTQQEMHRDPHNGFVLLAHTEPEGLFRPPHDHGRSWVIYAVQQGEIEMGTYARVQDSDGKVKLVKRGSTTVSAGQTLAFLPGDIHDTKCISGPALLFRFTERDLKKEDQEARKLTRYVEQDGDWVPKMHCSIERLES